MGAAINGYSNVVKLLLTKGAEVNVRPFEDSLNPIALIGAAEEGHTEIVKLLLDKGAVIGEGCRRWCDRVL